MLHVFRCKHRFEAIECQAPYQHSIEQWQNTFESCRKLNKDRALPKWDLINTPPVFDLFKHVPDLEQYDRLVLKPTIEYANAFKVSKVHLMMTDAIQKDDL